jgi:hypothetical protein
LPCASHEVTQVSLVLARARAMLRRRVGWSAGQALPRGFRGWGAARLQMQGAARLLLCRAAERMETAAVPPFCQPRRAAALVPRVSLPRHVALAAAAAGRITCAFLCRCCSSSAAARAACACCRPALAGRRAAAVAARFRPSPRRHLITPPPPLKQHRPPCRSLLRTRARTSRTVSAAAGAVRCPRRAAADRASLCPCFLAAPVLRRTQSCVCSTPMLTARTR